MAIIPQQYVCDACERRRANNEDGWFIVTLSRTPKYIGINRWENTISIPKTLEQRHACGKEHAIQLATDWLICI